MSSVSGVSSAQQSLLDQIKNQQNQDQQGWNAQFQQLLQGAGVDPTKIPALEKQIQDAVAAAKQNASGTTGNQANVKQAIDNVLKQNGIDPAKLQAGPKSGKGRKHHGHHTKPATGSTNPATSALGTTTSNSLAQNTLTGTLTGVGGVDVEA